MPRISLLSQETINKIAAGEVIEQPSCILRELLDNALDAGATKISVRVSYEDFALEVEDNGCGIPTEEVALAFQKHATSKITRFDEIYTTTTLGFRGEALASIGAVSKVIMETTAKEESDGTGIQYEIHGGKEILKKPIAHKPGTRIRIRELFFNTPVRRKFFSPSAKNRPSQQLSLRNIDKHNLKREMIRHLLSTDGVAFQYWIETNKEKPKLEINIPAQTSLFDKILIFFKSNSYGEDLAKCLLPVEEIRKDLTVRGYITNPSIREHRSDKQFFVINGRIVKDPLLLKAVNLAYLHVIPRGSHPMVFLRIDFKTSEDNEGGGEVDPNVHPRKELVKFKNKDNFFHTIMRVLKDTLQKSFTPSSLSSTPTASTPNALNTLINSKPSSSDFSTHAPKGTPSFSYTPDTKIPDLPKDLVFKDVVIDPYNVAGDIPPNHDLVESGKEIMVLGQIAKAFIVFAIGEDLFIVDQHAAHERINFDRLLTNIKTQEKSSTQLLLIPLLIERSTIDKDTILGAKGILAKLGFLLEDFGDNLIRITEIPTYIPEGKIETVVESLLNGILRRSSVGELEEEEFLGDLVARMACRMSIMVGDPLSTSAMEDLIRTLYQSGYVYTCPHGRPFVKKISLTEMKHFFDRGRHISGDIEN